jgi:hypothetical protein
MYFLIGTIESRKELWRFQLEDSTLGADALGAGSALDSAADALAAALSAGATLVGDAALAPPLKSVAYQPEPFNWNPAAVTCFLNVEWPHSGHISSGESDIFCNTSLANPQDSHL